jgi:hypothetical protein
MQEQFAEFETNILAADNIRASITAGILLPGRRFPGARSSRSAEAVGPP